MKKIAGVAAFAACAGALAPCFAQSKPKADAASAARALHARADKNSDGSVTYAELSLLVHDSVARQIQKRFKQLDRNRDGRCTRAEVNKMDPARFARFDLDRDGAFTRAELAQVMRAQVTERLRRVYVALDLDRDGRITLAEVEPAPKPVVVVATGTRTTGDL